MKHLNRKIWLLSAALIAVVAIACSGVEIIRPEDPTSEALLSTAAAVIDPAPTATVAPSETPPSPTATPVPGDATATVPTATSEPAPTQTPPPPSVSAPDTSGNAPLTVRFNVSDAPNIDSVSWDFGDGTISAELSPEHTFTIAGTHTVQLTVTDSSGQQIFAQSTTVNVSPGAVASIAISPENPTVAVLNAVQFSATAEDQFGNPVEPAPQWSLNGIDGEINPNGTFTAATVAGAFNDAIVVSSGDVTSSISLTVNPGPVATLELDQTEIDLAVQESVTIGVTARDEFGNEIANPTIAWNVAGDAGSVDAEGTFTAGTRAGEYGRVVFAAAAGVTDLVRSTASIHVHPAELAKLVVSPAEASVPVGSSQIFRAIGSDIHGNDIDDLVVDWSASGGLITADGQYVAANSGGLIEVTASTSRGSGTITGLASVNVPPNYMEFSQSDPLVTLGHTEIIGNLIRLIPSEITTFDSAGAIWYSSQQSIEPGFDTEFRYRAYDDDNEEQNDSAGGFAFVIQNKSTLALGNGGDGLGYHNIRENIALEFDTLRDVWTLDPNNNHVSLQCCKDVVHTFSLGYATPDFKIDDGEIHSIRVSYSQKTLEVFLDGSTTALLSVDVDLGDMVSLTDGQAWVGFTGSGYDGGNDIDILSWTFTPTLPAPDASFTANAASGPAPHAVTFTNTTLGAFTSVEWDFGDGATSAEVSPQHIYTVAGDYNVTLTMTGPGGTDTVVMENLITVEPGPITSITIEPFDIDVTVGESIQLTATAADEFGNEMTVEDITWAVASAAGSITQSGLLTGGGRVGVFADALTIDFLRNGIVSRANHDITINDGLIHLWSGDGTANDSVGTNHGTPLNGATFATGLFGDAFSLDGINDFVRLSEQPDLAGSFTVSAWIKIEANRLNDQHSVIGTDSFFLLNNTAGPQVADNDFEFGGPWGALHSTAVGTSEWTHLAATWDGTFVRLYADGIPDSEMRGFIGTNSNAVSAQIGRGHSGDDEGGPFAGLIDEVAIYKRALTDDEIIDLYEVGNAIKPPPGLVNHWTADGHANDVAGTNDGTRQNGASYGEGKVGQAFEFDGINDYVVLSDQPVLEEGFTFSAWVNVDEDGNPDERHIFNNHVLEVNVEALREYEFNFEVIASDLSGADSVSVTPATPGVWTHIAVSYDGDTPLLYVNGRLEGRGEITDLTSLVVEPRIGQGHTTALSESAFAGRIDEIKFHNRALSAEEIQKLIELDGGLP